MLGASDCEQLGTGWLVQPVNALSSLAFLPAGAWVAAQGRRTTGWRRWEHAAVGAALIANGIGSFAYHGPQPGWAQVAHDGPIVAVVALLAANEIGRHADPVESRTTRREHRIALVAGAGALAAYLLGRTGSPACRPESLFQWHAVWHVLAAVSLAAAAEARIERG